MFTEGTLGAAGDWPEHPTDVNQKAAMMNLVTLRRDMCPFLRATRARSPSRFRDCQGARTSQTAALGPSAPTTRRVPSRISLRAKGAADRLVGSFSIPSDCDQK